MTVIPSQLTLEPRPLLFSNNNVVLSWSPKSGCSQALIWFLIHEGLLQESNQFDPWPHNYRQKRYYDSENYSRRLADLINAGGKGYTLIKITRDPVKRLVSCFRHAIQYPAIDSIVEAKVGTQPERDGLSLKDFRDALAGEDLVCWKGFDMHICAQQQPVWFYSFDRVITLNIDQTNMFPGLNDIEDELGMQKTVFSAYPKFANLAAGHHAKDIAFDAGAEIETHRFPRTRHTEFPKSALLAAPLMLQAAWELHGRDFQSVASGDSANRLFQTYDTGLTGKVA
ncbi:sulfotransferase family protein [Ruegeria sp. WL0004]|uniref:Sulfotransferase family protein n=1 Tax=Ruegeria marisflavi TaxID=2984152 RepID=A0ABT2WMF3_9RHOB|nr:sulfotransferase family protein [Ruegeria sp. WL0004]MCU9837016.1 sulfotransferase family protein [Ruegeria sp. WL0004]